MNHSPLVLSWLTTPIPSWGKGREGQQAELRGTPLLVFSILKWPSRRRVLHPAGGCESSRPRRPLCWKWLRREFTSAWLTLVTLQITDCRSMIPQLQLDFKSVYIYIYIYVCIYIYTNKYIYICVCVFKQCTYCMGQCWAFAITFPLLIICNSFISTAVTGVGGFWQPRLAGPSPHNNSLTDWDFRIFIPASMGNWMRWKHLAVTVGSFSQYCPPSCKLVYNNLI